MIENVMKVARGDYSVQNALSPENDDLDALAMGLNMMIDDLRNNLDLEERNKEMQAINTRLRRATVKAMESDRLKSAFLANISHEIRTPLNAILGFSALLQNDCSDMERSKEFLIHIQKAGKNLLALINDVLDISRLDTDQLTIKKEFHNLDEILDQVIRKAEKEEILRSKPELKLVGKSVPGEDSCRIETDRLRLEQIMQKLIDNAIRFTEKGTIEIGKKLLNEGDGNVVELYVKDTGIGIPADMHDKIFERFRQVQRDHFQEGAGLGLSLARGIAEKLGGSIRLKSEEGKGSTFYVSIPCTVRDSAEAGVEGTDERGGLSGKLIYIAEDTRTSYLFLEEVLRPSGPVIKQAEDGVELLRMIDEREPDLVLLDIRMPVMDGYEAIREIRKKKYKFPVIAQTTFAEADEREAILKAGCDGYIAKPIKPAELIEAIGKHINQAS